MQFGRKKPQVYIAGPMRGVVDYNYPLFNLYAEVLRSKGWTVCNPAENDNDVLDEIVALEKDDNPLKVYMRKDLNDVLTAKCVFVLPGWQQSKGACLEVHVAWETDTPVYDIETFEQIEKPVPILFTGSAISDEIWEAAKVSEVLPTDSQARKDIPIVTGVLDYFPAALAAVAQVSKAGNDKHNPGEPLHWARGKSMDQADCIGRHLLERGGVDPETGQLHSAQLAWRALAMLQIELEEQGDAPLARGASA